MRRGAVVGLVSTCTVSALFCSWAYRVEVDLSASPYDFAFEKPKKGTEVTMIAGDGPKLADAIQFQLRPLFSPSRRPEQIDDPEPAPAPEEVDAPPTAPVAASARLKLLGTEKAGGGGTALIADEDSGMSNWVPAGGTIGGWRVLEVHADTVLLASDEPSALPEGETKLKLTLYPEQAGP